MNMRFAAACCAGFFSFAAAAAAAEPGLLFYASFDNRTDADYAAGEASGKIMGSAKDRFASGVKNQALRVGKTGKDLRSVTFAGAGNINPKRGTLSFYFKPENWNRNVKAFQHLFYAFGTDDGKRSFLLIDRYMGKDELVVEDRCGEAGNSFRQKTGHWRDGLWHHLGVVWGGDSLCVYVDGEPRYKKTGFNRLSGAWKTMIIGAMNWNVTQGTALIDEVKIYDRQLSAEDMEKAAAAIPSSAGKDGLLFAHSFDKGANADFAAGNPAAVPLTPSGPLFVPGVKGNGLRLGWGEHGERMGLNFYAGRNFRPSAGTVAFWFKPENWRQNKGKHKHLVSFHGGSGLFTIYQELGDRFGITFGKDRIFVSGNSLKDGEWHHCAVTWDAANIRLYRDGLLLGECVRKDFSPHGWDRMTVGAMNWSKSHRAGTAVIDELRIYNRALPQTEIESLARPVK